MTMWQGAEHPRLSTVLQHQFDAATAALKSTSGVESGSRKEVVISDELLRQMRLEIKRRRLKRWSVKPSAPD
jgi:hypothetical protein